MIGGFKRRVRDGFCNQPAIDELLCEQCWLQALIRDGGMPLYQLPNLVSCQLIIGKAVFAASHCFAITVTLASRDKDSTSIFMNEPGAESSTTAHGYAARCSPRAVRSYNLYPNPPKTYILSGPYSSSGIDELKQL